MFPAQATPAFQCVTPAQPFRRAGMQATAAILFTGRTTLTACWFVQKNRSTGQPVNRSTCHPDSGP